MDGKKPFILILPNVFFFHFSVWVDGEVPSEAGSHLLKFMHKFSFEQKLFHNFDFYPLSVRTSYFSLFAPLAVLV